MGNVIVRRLIRLWYKARSTNRSWTKVRLIANKDQWNTCVLSYSRYLLNWMWLWAWCNSAHTRKVRVPHGGEDDPPFWAGPIDRFGVSAGETGESSREFPGARPACRGTPETPADNIGCSLRARTEVVIVYRRGCSVRARTELTVCAERGLRFGREPNCVRGRRLFPGR